MNELLQYLDVLVITVGALLGSIKASVEFDREKSLFVRITDVVLGLYIGVSVAFYFGANFSLWLNGLLAIVGGASGAMVLEVIMQMIPSVTRKFIKNWIDNKLK